MMRRKTAIFSALLAVIGLLAGCVPDAPPPRLIPTAEPFCQAVQTVCISKDDVLTEPTAQGIEANNRGRQSLIKSKACKPRPEDECKKQKPTS